jgi:hypothetical protein
MDDVPNWLLYTRLGRVLDALDLILQRLDRLTRQGERTMADLSALTTEVSENNDAIQSAQALLGRLADELRAAATDQDAVNALADQLDSQTSALAAAVVANTPADPNGGTAPEEPAPPVA